jgi:signal peptidase I
LVYGEDTLKHPGYVILAIISIVCIGLFVVSDAPFMYEIYEHRESLYASTGIGYSMEPTISNGDTIIILTKNAPDFSVDVGDILVYQNTDGFAVAHRVYNIDNNRYFVKGDGNKNVDSWFVSESQVIGKVIGTVSKYNVIGKALTEEILG